MTGVGPHVMEFLLVKGQGLKARLIRSPVQGLGGRLTCQPAGQTASGLEGSLRHCSTCGPQGGPEKMIGQSSGARAKLISPIARAAASQRAPRALSTGGRLLPGARATSKARRKKNCGA